MRSFERAAKRSLIRLTAPIFPSRRAGAVPPARLLVVRVDDRLGNLILLSPLFTWLREVCPETRVDLLASRAFACLYAHDDRIGRVHVIDKQVQKLFFPAFLRDLGRLGAASFDAALECSDRNAFSFNSALYTQATRAPRRVGFANDLAGSYLTDSISPPADGHAARDPLLLAGALLGAEPPPLSQLRLRLILPRPAGTWEETLGRLSEGSEGRIVGIHVGGRGQKRWAPEEPVRLAAGLADSGWRPWIFHGPMEPDAGALYHALEPRGVRVVPRAPILEVAQAFARCALVIAPDTGPMHLAGAVGTPTLALFLSSDLDRYRPIAPHDRWIDGRGRDVGAGEVLAAARAMLDAGSAAGSR
jgi:ADP-heptose:LPS heptosyltransferase